MAHFGYARRADHGLTRALIVALDSAPGKGAPTHHGNNREESSREEDCGEEDSRQEGSREEDCGEEGSREEDRC